ncbi:MAG TPA: hypothetical protein VMX55_11160 [candidate division Zixibacteria bacterium]|nr:hypothetical protein [candidate division Zixibacteria bacterium]
MLTQNKLGVVLIEFDSLKGPIIRKKNPQNYDLSNISGKEDFLMWVIRASEFSVRKIDDFTAYAKAISLSDPNFSRKKRQFGLAVISKLTFDIIEAEKMLNSIIEKCKKYSDNKSYFKMLNELLQIINDYKPPEKIIAEKIFQTKNEFLDQLNIDQKFENIIKKEKIKEDIPFLIVSEKLQVFNKVSIKTKEESFSLIIGKSSTFNNLSSKQQISISSEKISLEVILQNSTPLGLQTGLEILIRILNTIMNLEEIVDRMIVGIEFLDRLLYENVDIQYYLPFVQYLISMESYTITEFKIEDFEKQFVEFQETHGEWINCLIGQNLDGKKLTEFFKLTGIKREGLELLIDLLFVKLIAIF